MTKWIAALAGAMAFAGTPAVAKAETPKLVILISIDQFSADLFNSSRGDFSGGLGTLAKGIVYSNAFHAHGVTETCAGHAVIASGRHPNATGIIANQWYDQKTGENSYCTDDGTHVAAHATRKSGTGPGLLKVSTVGDWLKAASPTNRVFAVAGKDRSAIMMGGHRPDGAFWFDGKLGLDSWGDSQEDARRRLAPLASFNSALSARLGSTTVTWTYKRESCKALESVLSLPGGGHFRSQLPPDPPAAVPGRPPASGAVVPPWYYDRVTMDAALSLLESEALGRSSGTDLLAIGLSATDMVGHAYGTQGPEMCDQLARVDEEIGRLLKRIEGLRVPVLIALTADHGGADMPERLAMRGYRSASRIDAAGLLADLNTKVRMTTGIDWDPLRPAFFDPTQLVIVDAEGRTLADAALRDRIALATAERALSLPGIAGAWTEADLRAVKPGRGLSPDLLPVADRMALSFYPERSANVLLATDPLKIAAPPLPGLFMMGHSGPSDFNRRVPLLFWWPGVVHQERSLPIQVVDLAPTLAAAVGVTPTDPQDGDCLDLIGDGMFCRLSGSPRK